MGGWGRGMGRKVIWHAHGWFFLYVNVVSPWLMFSPSVIVLEVNVSIAVNLFRSLFSCLPSCCRSLFCSSCFCFFCLGSANISPSWAPESFLLVWCFSKAVWFQASVPLAQLSDNWDKPSLGLYAFKSLRCQSTLSMTFKQTKHAVNHSCWEAGINAGFWVLYSSMRIYRTCLWLVVPLEIHQLYHALLEPYSAYWATAGLKNVNKNDCKTCMLCLEITSFLIFILINVLMRSF